jgi:hypothetical protein
VQTAFHIYAASRDLIDKITSCTALSHVYGDVVCYCT